MSQEQETGMSLKSKELMPTGAEQRSMSNMAFLMLWIGIAVQLVTFIAGAQLYPALSPAEILLTCLIGNFVVAILLTLMGDIGIRYGIPYAVYIRACFGYLGTHIPAAIRAIPAVFWFGFQTWMGAFALNTIMKVLTGYSNLTLLIIVFGALQIINTAMGMDAISKFEWLASPSLLIIGVAMQIMVMNAHHLTLGSIFSMHGKGGISIGFAIAVQMGTYITMALNAPDFTRFLKVSPNNLGGSWWQANKGSFFGHSIGLVASMLLFTLIGLTSGIATGNWNPVEVIVQTVGQNSPLLLLVCLAFIILAQWSTNISANLLPPAYIIINFFPRKINLVTASIIAGVIGLLIQPWNYSDQIPTILVIITALLGPIAGIMFCDYYLLRKRQLNVEELYKAGGQYRYWKNINPAALLAYLPAFLLGFFFPDYGFINSFVVSIVVYYPAMKYWIVKIYPQPEISEPPLTSEKITKEEGIEYEN
ncbi:cytosine permease [Aneurinibacillus sp. Ricciae_BoGa-3]|uniref:cytosine permease n=1 Tax=Aneurinibacillus sp. Ricciae_BoGa-3 TaxID=3022697 RepID=UPI002340E3C8|nr:cytosine permease [Aneurinibacillus sp. Ricciae_BoGa-3]WCK55164.1 cytosine permease [Aneurinibacillus sp. Ricciae_BoGa-3]